METEIDPAMIDRLVELMANDSADFCDLAAHALASIGGPAVDRLKEVFEEGKPSTTTLAALALCHSGSEGVEFVRTAITGHPKGYKRREAANALVSFVGEDDFDTLFAFWRDGWTIEERRPSLETILSTRHREAFGARLIDLLRVPGQELRAATMIVHLEGVAGAGDALYPLCRAHTEDATYLFALGLSRDPRAFDLLLPLLESDGEDDGDEEDEGPWSGALTALAACGGSRAVPFLLPFLEHPYGLTRRSAVDALARTGDAEATIPVLRALYDREAVHAAIRAAWNGDGNIYDFVEHAAVQIDAANALARLGAPDALERLLPCLLYEDEQQTYVGASPIQGFVCIGQSAVEPVAAAAVADDLSPVKITAAMVLGELRDARAVPALLQLIEHSPPIGEPWTEDYDEFVSGMAAAALGKIGDRRAVEPLCRLLGHTEFSVWSNVREALLAMPDPRAADALSAHLINTYVEGRILDDDVAFALTAIGGDAAFDALRRRWEAVTDDRERDATALALAWLNDKRAIPQMESIKKQTEAIWLTLTYLRVAPPEWRGPQFSQ